MRMDEQRSKESGSGRRKRRRTSVPDVEQHRAVRRVEGNGVDLDSERRDVLPLKLAAHVTFHEGCLAGAAIADEHHLECSVGVCVTVLHDGRCGDVGFGVLVISFSLREPVCNVPLAMFND